MSVAIRFSEQEELEALPILLRHSPGTVLADGVYVVSEAAARALTQGGVTYTLVATDRNPPTLSGGTSGERI